MGKILWAILALILLFAFSSVIGTGIHDLRTDELNQDFDSITTGAGTTANITLPTDPFLDSVSEIESITSSLYPAENATASSYVTATNTLTVGSLLPGQTRTLTVVWNAEIDDTYMAIIGPFMTFFIFGGILFAIGYGVLKHRR